MNKYQEDPVEFRRIVAMIRAGATYREITWLLRDHLVFEFATSLNIITSSKNRLFVAYLAWKKLKIENPRQPFIPASELPDVILCDSCGGLGEAKGLRWFKLNQGGFLTWSIDRSGIGNIPAFSDNEIQGWFDVWTTIAGLPPAVKTSDIGDCHIDFKPIDGPGKTLGFVLQPRAPVEDMARGGRLAGDMTIDSSERSWPLLRTRYVGKHEVGHVFGMDHEDMEEGDRDALMFPFIQGNGDRNPNSTDRKGFVVKYPNGGRATLKTLAKGEAQTELINAIVEQNIRGRK